MAYLDPASNSGSKTKVERQKNKNKLNLETKQNFLAILVNFPPKFIFTRKNIFFSKFNFWKWNHWTFVEIKDKNQWFASCINDCMVIQPSNFSYTWKQNKHVVNRVFSQEFTGSSKKVCCLSKCNFCNFFHSTFVALIQNWKQGQDN